MSHGEGPGHVEADRSAFELAITTITHDHADRIHSYEVLAKAWND